MGGQEYLEERPARSMGAKLDDLKKYNTPAPNAYNSEKGQEYLEERPAKSLGVRLEEAKKFLTPAPNAYNSEKGDDYLAENIKHSFGLKPDDMPKYLTPAPNTYDADKGQEYLEKTPAKTMGAKLSDLKGFSTPAPTAYRPEDCKEEKAAIAFGIKHSPYVGSLKGDSYVRARTETVKTPVQTQEDFRPRSGTFTKTERPTIIKTIRTTTQLSQPVA